MFLEIALAFGHCGNAQSNLCYDSSWNASVISEAVFARNAFGFQYAANAISVGVTHFVTSVSCVKNYPLNISGVILNIAHVGLTRVGGGSVATKQISMFTLATDGRSGGLFFLKRNPLPLFSSIVRSLSGGVASAPTAPCVRSMCNGIADCGGLQHFGNLNHIVDGDSFVNNLDNSIYCQYQYDCT